MKLDIRVRTLGSVDHLPLKEAVRNVAAETWLEDELRQKAYEVHKQTQSIILLFAEGWPRIKVVPRSGWQYFSSQAEPLMNQIIDAHYPKGGKIIRAMVAKLIAGGVIEEHMDHHPSFAIAHRIHVPLITNDKVEFTIDGDMFHLSEGVAYEVSNLDYHAVANRSAEDRVHFIFDYVAPEPQA